MSKRPAPGGPQAAYLARLVGSQALDAIREVDGLWPALRDASSPTGPHRQRTAINRLRTLQRCADAAGLWGKAERRAVMALREWQGRLGVVRDWDMCLGRAAELGEGAGGAVAAAVAVVSAMLQEARRREGEALLADVDGPQGAAARRALEELEHAVRVRLARAGDAPEPTAEERAAMAAVLVAPVLPSWEERLAAAHGSVAPEDLHAFRRVNKRLRDVARFVADDVDPAWEGRAAALQELHAILGAINDFHVVGARVRPWVAGRASLGAEGEADARAAARFLRRLAKREADELARLMEVWARAHALRGELRGESRREVEWEPQMNADARG